MIYIDAEYCDLRKIADSGQCFRWRETGTDVWEVPAFDRVLTAKTSGDSVVLDCSNEDFNAVWNAYFDESGDYAAYHSAILGAELPYLTEAANTSKGIRILRQDLWETVVSFIISQCNNIPRIKLCLNRIIERFGHFPKPNEITRGSLAGLSLGYRDEYLYDAAEKFTDAMTDFRVINGVGAKVDNCIRLYGLGRKDAFPRDTWIKRIEHEQFGGHFPEELFSGFAGVAQQYLFYYARQLSSRQSREDSR
jgi:N-glycosylase/DNA lyase